MDNPEHKRNEEVGKYFFDLSKLAFTGLVIGSVLELKDGKGIILIIGGSILTLSLALLGSFNFKKNI
ncbi:MAG: DUF6722 family protein [Cytophagales bacterium]